MNNKKTNHHGFISDHSHLSMSMKIFPRLYKLPHHYHDIYNIVAPFHDQLYYDVNGTKKGAEPPELAICLITGTVLPAGSKIDRKSFSFYHASISLPSSPPFSINT
jgi:hypothetical protein